MLEVEWRKNSSKGFTLLELLVAFTIGAMIIGIMVGVLRLGIRSWEKGHQRVDGYQHLRMMTEQIMEDMRSAFHADSDKVTSFVGENDKVTFHTTTGGLRPLSDIYGVRRVSYYIDFQGRLVMEEGYPFDESVAGGEAVPLFGRAESIEFRYYNEKGDIKEWFNNWDSKEFRGLPGAVEITLVAVIEEDKRIELPPVIVPIYTGRIINTSAAAVRGSTSRGVPSR